MAYASISALVSTLSSLNISGTSTSAVTMGPLGTSFVFDTVNNRLGIGTAPAANRPIDILIDSVSTFQSLAITTYGTQSSGFRGRAARGTLASPSAVTSSMSLTSLSAVGYGDTQFSVNSVALIDLQAAATFTDSSNPTFIRFATTPSGSVTRAEAMRINSTGNVLIGTTSDDATNKVQISGTITATNFTASETSYTPTVSGLGTVTVNYATYMKIGNFYYIRASITSGTVAASAIKVSLPGAINAAVSADTLLMGNGGSTYNGGAFSSLTPIVLNADKANIQFGHNVGRSILTPINGDFQNNGDTLYFTAVVPV